MDGTKSSEVRTRYATTLVRQPSGERTILDALLRDRGMRSLRDQGEYLGLGYSTLSRAHQGRPVSAAFVARALAKFPGVRYQALFVTSEIAAEHDVRDKVAA
jgi:hypothetical protein